MPKPHRLANAALGGGSCDDGKLSRAWDIADMHFDGGNFSPPPAPLVQRKPRCGKQPAAIDDDADRLFRGGGPSWIEIDQLTFAVGPPANRHGAHGALRGFPPHKLSTSDSVA